MQFVDNTFRGPHTIETCCLNPTLVDNADRLLGQIAAEAGFADQAHLTREVKLFTGKTARRLRRRAA